MELLNPYESFIPKLEEKIGQNKIIVIKDAKGGQPIRRWFKKWNEKKFKKKSQTAPETFRPNDDAQAVDVHTKHQEHAQRERKRLHQ